MKISIPRSELKEAVNGLSRVISHRTTIPALGHVLVSAVGKTVTMTGTDLDQTATYVAEKATVEDNDEGFLVSLESLKPFIKGNDKDLITFDHKGEKVNITNPVGSAAFTTAINTMPVNDFPAEFPKVKTHSVDRRFLVNFQRLMACASIAEDRRILNGVHLDVSEKSHNMVATDGRRLMSFNSMELPINLSCTVPVTKFLSWHRMAEDDQHLSIGAKKVNETIWFSLVSQAWNYQVRTIDGTYPSWRQVVPANDGDHALSIGEEDASMLAKTLPQFPGHDQKYRPITLSGAEGILTLLGPDDTDARLTLKASIYTGKPGSVNIDRRYFMDALEAGFRTFAFVDEWTPLTAVHPEGGRYVLMPIGPEKPQQPQKEGEAAQPETSEQEPVTTATHKEEAMPETTIPQKEEPTTINPLDKLLAAFEAAKARIREANAALGDIAEAIKLAVREQRHQRSELENARMYLGKLQSVKI